MSDLDGFPPTPTDSPKRRRRWRKVGGQRELPSGKIQVRVRGNTPDGVPFALEQTVAAHLADAVLAKFRDLGEQYRAGLLVPEQTVTLAEWQRTYVQKRNVPSEIKRWTGEQRSTWKMLRRLHRLPLQALTQDAITGWVAAIAYKGTGRPERGSGKASPSYIRHCFELLNRLVQAAIDARVIARCPWGNKVPACIPSYARARRKRRPLESHEIGALLSAAAGATGDETLRLRLWTLFQTGVRPHELARARIEWMLPVEAVPSIAQVPGAGVLRLPAAKRGQPHLATLDRELHAALRAHVVSMPAAARATGLLFPVFFKARWRARSAFVQPVTFARLRKAAQLGPDVVLYQARHTRLSDVANDPRMGTRAAQAIAGHQRDSSIIHTYLGKVDAAITAAAFEPSPTLAVALKSAGPAGARLPGMPGSQHQVDETRQPAAREHSKRPAGLRSDARSERPPSAGPSHRPDGDDDPTDPPRGKTSPDKRGTVHARGTAKKPAPHRNAKAQLDFGADGARAPGHAVPGARGVPSVPSEETGTVHAHAGNTAQPLNEGAGTSVQADHGVPSDRSTLTMPADDRLFLVAERVQHEGADAVAAALLSSLGPADGAAFASELAGESAVLPALQRAALDALIGAVRRRSLLSLVPAVPFEGVSAVVAVGCETSRSRFTRKIPSESGPT